MPKGTNFPAGIGAAAKEKWTGRSEKKESRRPKEDRPDGRKGTASAKRGNGRRVPISGK